MLVEHICHTAGGVVGMAYLKKPALMRLRQFSLLYFSGVVISGSPSAVYYPTEQSSPVEAVPPEPASVLGAMAALHWFSLRPGRVVSLPSLFTDNLVELCGFTFVQTPLDLVLVLPSDISF